VKRTVSRGLAVGAAALLATGVVAGCGSSSGGGSNTGSGGSGNGGSSGSSSVKIAFFGALTGPNAQLGINIEQGAQLAIDQYNATNPKIRIVLKKYDTQGDPNQAQNLAPTVVKDKVAGVVGPAFSGESLKADPIFDQGQIPNISPSATNDTIQKQGFKFWHRVLANDDVQGPGVGDYITKQLAAKKVAVIDDASDYGKGLADIVAKTVKKNGAQVVDREEIDPKASDYSSTVNKIKAANPDAVFYGGYYAEAGKFVKQLRDAGVQAKFISGDGSLDQKFISGGGPAAEGAYLTCTCVLATASDDPTVQKFINDYKAKFNALPATYTAEGYDAATAFVKAVQAGKTTSTDINSYLSTEDFQGVSKHIKWQPNGELAGGSVYIHKVENGKIVALGDYQSAGT
jgi:branched-chain amino acid transport system substrate-binding protein